MAYLSLKTVPGLKMSNTFSSDSGSRGAPDTSSPSGLSSFHLFGDFEGLLGVDGLLEHLQRDPSGVRVLDEMLSAVCSWILGFHPS